ncbi:hypothetical protein AYI68_g7131 [Smittium mucronatum]|uniref:DUF7137 domain-containing protein n=1 Tax=Smittium mucronatum TaxID=133383 RepID=A0A1R0GPL8_9FUNG|nr:hypothetical protein AYI68_g7131 [Smittium mucronatum]
MKIASILLLFSIVRSQSSSDSGAAETLQATSQQLSSVSANLSAEPTPANSASASASVSASASAPNSASGSASEPVSGSASGSDTLNKSASGSDTDKPSSSANSQSDDSGDSTTNDGDDANGDSSSDDESSDDGEMSGDDSGNGQPGRIQMITPPNTMANPLFELDSKVSLTWKYNKDTTSPPERLSIIGQMPNNGQFNQPGTNLPIQWNIAVNISGTKYVWDTKTQTPQGISLSAVSGYRMFFFDADIGFKEGNAVHVGRIINFSLGFSMYRSDYSNTNDGVPKNYNPNSSPSQRPTLYILCIPSILLLVLTSSLIPGI